MVATPISSQIQSSGVPVIVSAEAATPTSSDDLRNNRILIIDDEPAVSETLRMLLKRRGYTSISTVNNPLEAMPIIRSSRVDLVILDIYMPERNGLEVLRDLRAEAEISSIPVIVMTNSGDQRIRDAALQLQANDFLNKPLAAHQENEMDARVYNLLMLKSQHDQLRDLSKRLEHEIEIRTKELFATRQEAITCMARAAESRDTETGLHVLRVGHYAAIIARRYGMDEDSVSWIELAAQLHDVGKLSIPEKIIHKPAKLTPEERFVMEGHCDAATAIFHGPAHSPVKLTSPLLQMAARIAETHHEKWDGSGYPKGLSGEAIPLEGRITAVADVFDALSSKRNYKDAFALENCFEILEEGRGSHFDPKALDAFFASKKEVLEVYERWQDQILDPSCSKRNSSKI